VGEEQLITTVLRLADEDGSLSEDAKLVVLAALESDEALAEALEEPSSARRPDIIDPCVTSDPVGAYLTSISVAGFRGVGPETRLELSPGPGLVVVAGRNGSGKSSFSEGLEVALTGNSYRWLKARGVAWTEDWRNLHCPDPCLVRIELAEEGRGRTTVGVDWAVGADRTVPQTWVQRSGAKREPGIDTLGWETAMRLHRPFLSYEELGGLLEAGPSALYDALSPILGLEAMTVAERRLDAAHKRVAEPEKQAAADRRQLRAVLDLLDDPRAHQAGALLRKSRPDLDAVQALATGTAANDPASTVARLRAAAALTWPTTEAVAAGVRELQKAMAEAATSAGGVASAFDRRSRLLREALDYHRDHGDVSLSFVRNGHAGYGLGRENQRRASSRR